MTEDVEALLASLQAERQDTRGRLADIQARTRQIRADFGALVRDDEDGLPAGIVAALLDATGPEAPVHFRRIRERVEEGQFTWTELYADPEGVVGPEGRDLVRRAVHAGYRPPPEDELPDAPPGATPGSAPPAGPGSPSR